jgi:hypothetical protein
MEQRETLLTRCKQRVHMQRDPVWMLRFEEVAGLRETVSCAPALQQASRCYGRRAAAGRVEAQRRLAMRMSIVRGRSALVTADMGELAGAC